MRLLSASPRPVRVRRIRDDIDEQGELDAVDEIVAEDAVVHGLLRDFSGRDEIREMFAVGRSAR